MIQDITITVSRREKHYSVVVSTRDDSVYAAVCRTHEVRIERVPCGCRNCDGGALSRFVWERPVRLEGDEQIAESRYYHSIQEALVAIVCREMRPPKR